MKKVEEADCLDYKAKRNGGVGCGATKSRKFQRLSLPKLPINFQSVPVSCPAVFLSEYLRMPKQR